MAGVAPAPTGRGRARLRRMPPLAVALDLTLLHQLGHHPVQVIRLDFHRLGDLRDRDPGLTPNELQCLVGASVPATPTAPAPACTSCRGGGGSSGAAATARGGTRGPTRAAAGADESG